MRILTVVTARGGSKRLPGKNLRLLGDRPLIVWSIDIARRAAGMGLCDVLVSTDDEQIATVARNAGALVPWLRPEHLATDTASSVDVCIQALDWYEAQRGAVDGLLLLQPTSPFRTESSLMCCIDLFARHGRRPVVSLSPTPSHPYWCYQIEGDIMRPFFDEQAAAHKRSQDLPPAYVTNGAYYLIRPSDLRDKQSFYPANAVPLIIENSEESLDIDTEWDWLAAEAVIRSRAKNRSDYAGNCGPAG